MVASWLPTPLARLHELVTAQASRLAGTHSRLLSDVNLGPTDTVAAVSRSIELLTDDRAMVTAYLHGIAETRPPFTSIARAQNISPSSLRHRYTEAQVESIRSLIDEKPELDCILAPFPSFHDYHLLHIEGGDYPEIIARREELRNIFFEFADRMERPDRDYSNPQIRTLCFKFGLSYETAEKLALQEHEDSLSLRIESLELQHWSNLREEHPGRSRRLISEYPRGMMLESLKARSSDYTEFYLKQVA